jgi:hypothetical protein
MSNIKGDFALRGGASTTIGAELRGAMVLGARLRLLALDGATDISLFFSLFLCGVKFEEALDSDEELCSDTESLLKEATSAWSSHSRTWPNLSSHDMTPVCAVLRSWRWVYRSGWLWSAVRRK